jgi:predicted amidohydrolase YtcJ
MASSKSTKFLKFSYILPIFLLFLIILQGLFSQQNLNKKHQNPVIYYNGAIFTLEKDKTGKEKIEQALRTENGKITHIGTNEKILKLKNNKTTLFDLNGKSLFPAFVEKNLEKENIMKEVFYQMKEISKKGYWNDSHEKLALFLEGFRSLTIKPAIENNEDKNIGSIKVGKLANFIILDKNPLLYNPAKYNEIEVYTTVLEGRLIH